MPAILAAVEFKKEKAGMNPAFSLIRLLEP